MNREVATVTPTSLLQDAVRKMNELRIGCLVVESEGKAVGIITERDILGLVENGRSPHDLLVNSVMSSPLTIIDQDVGIQDASSLMLERRIRRLPIVTNGRLVGIITSTDIIRAAKAGIAVSESAQVSNMSQADKSPTAEAKVVLQRSREKQIGDQDFA